MQLAQMQMAMGLAPPADANAPDAPVAPDAPASGKSAAAPKQQTKKGADPTANVVNTPYAQKVMERSKPDMNRPSGV